MLNWVLMRLLHFMHFKNKGVGSTGASFLSLLAERPVLSGYLWSITQIFNYMSQFHWPPSRNTFFLLKNCRDLQIRIQWTKVVTEKILHVVEMLGLVESIEMLGACKSCSFTICTSMKMYLYYSAIHDKRKTIMWYGMWYVNIRDGQLALHNCNKMFSRYNAFVKLLKVHFLLNYLFCHVTAASAESIFFATASQGSHQVSDIIKHEFFKLIFMYPLNSKYKCGS